MCTAATYKTKDFYFGRTLDYEFSYGDEVTVTPRNYKIPFRYMGEMESHYALIGMAYVAEDYPLYYDAVNEKGVGMIVSPLRATIGRLFITLSISFPPFLFLCPSI